MFLKEWTFHIPDAENKNEIKLIFLYREELSKRSKNKIIKPI